MLPAIEASEVGNTGLVWLLLSYGYVLYFSSNMIAEGSDLLLLVPSMAGLVGGVILPVLASVPDGAIMLFSGLGPMDEAQETLSVGVGTLAGSTIMLLTIPWALGIFNGRVDLDENENPDYRKKPKLTLKESILEELRSTGVSITDPVRRGGIVMAITSIPYFLIQAPAFFIHGPSEELAMAQHWWSLAGFFVCVIGFFSYLYLQLRISKSGTDRLKRVDVMKRLMKKGAASLSGVLGATLESAEAKLATNNGRVGGTGYQAVDSSETEGPSPEVRGYLEDVLSGAFKIYDVNGDGKLEKYEVDVFLHDCHESVEHERTDEIFNRMDVSKDGVVTFDEFVTACYFLIKAHQLGEQGKPQKLTVDAKEAIGTLLSDEDDDEQEEIPTDFSKLSPAEQQAAIKKRAFTMLFVGTVLVVMFSDPVVHVLQETANRMGLSPFYVAFVLAPLASNASEILASQYYAKKKTRATITVAYAELMGAGTMNNTFCLSIFMGLIYWRGLAWEYTAETIAIVAVEFIMACMVQTTTMTAMHGVAVLSLFPLSIAFIALLEFLGIN